MYDTTGHNNNVLHIKEQVINYMYPYTAVFQNKTSLLAFW